MKTIQKHITSGTARALAVAVLTTCAASGASAATSYSTLLNISNNQNWRDPAWGEVTIEEDDAMGLGGLKFTVNLCDDESPQCSSGPSDDYGSGQNTIEQFGFNFDGALTMDMVTPANGNVRGAPEGWELHTTEGMDGFGSFLYALSRGSKADTVEPLVFWIVTSGDGIADYARLGSTGGQPHAGSLFSVKVAADGPGAFIGGGTEVPLPGTLGLLGVGIAALGMIRKRA